jgi:hypothetical protein
VYGIRMDGGGTDSVSGSRRRGGTHPDQHKRGDNSAPSRCGNGLTAMPSHWLADPRGPMP